MSTLMIIDGNSIINRAFYGIRTLTTKEGIPTNAVYGFLNILFKTLDEVKPDYLTVAFDVKRETFRNQLFSDYKKHRSGMPDDLAAQMPILKEVLAAMNISYLEKEGYEADDIIGTVSNFCSKNNVETKILTGDRDDLQLASDLTTIMLVTTKDRKTTTINYDDKGVFSKYEITPTEFIDLKALMGDQSDNIPGVKGIGEVTALKLIKQFKSIENIYENLDDKGITKTVKTKLESDKEMAFLSKKLATIDINVPIDLSLDSMEIREPNLEVITPLFEKLEFQQFIKKFSLKSEKKVETVEIINGINNLKHIGDIFFFYIFEDKFYINIEDKVYCSNIIEELFFLKPILEDENIKKITFGVKDAIVYFMEKFDINISGIYFDLKLADYVLDPSLGKYSLSNMVYQHLGYEPADDFCAVKYIKELFLKVYDKLSEQNLLKLYYDVELPTTNILASMQLHGVKVNVDELNVLKLKFSESLYLLENKIYELSEEKFNINSPKQLGYILFEKMGLKSGKKTKTGYSTDQSVLENIRNEHEIIEYIIQYRQIAKLKSTYVEGILPLCDTKNVLHSNFHQTVTQTGRLSSSEPNLQNIPIRLELGRELRKVFIPVNSDNIFIGADYSQIELRVLAQISGDENLFNAFINNEDIHTQAASRIFNMPYEMVTSKMRSDAKTVNFGILYGKTEFTLAKDLQISLKESKEIISNYLDKYPKIRDYMSNIIEYAKENGYVRTMFGRIRYIKELSDRNFNIRKFGERIALNTPIQGTAADIIKLAMIEVSNNLKKEKIDGQIVLQIHDEIIVEVSKNDKERAMEILKESMENAVKINVPLTVSLNHGDNLYELK